MNEIINVEAKDITAEYEDAVRTHQQIMANGAIAAEALLKLCKNLKHMRDEKLYEQLGYDAFENYCEEMAGIKERMAYTYISAYERLGPSVLQSNANLGITKLALIAGMNPIERAEGLANGEFENMSVSEIKELIKKNKEQGEQITMLTLQLENEKNADLAESAETDKLKERIKELEEQIAKNSEYDAEADEMYERVKQLEEELRKKDSAHKIELEQLSETISANLREELTAEIKTEMSAEQPQDNGAAQEQIDAAVAAALKEREKELKAKFKEKSAQQDEKIKDLEETVTAAGTEKEKLQKQLALSDTKSAKAMVYIDALQNNFNSLFAIIAEMDVEQQNKFKGAVLKLTSAMQKKAGE
ncbi:MAG: hypothetical protein K2G60_03630 [Oscillospiraceae bacterium]|nr:hypothetical protein [Oscillospiraceae bacterium]